MWEVFQINSYMIELYASRPKDPAMITLNLAGRKRVFLHFKSSAGTLPSTSKSADGLRYAIYMGKDMLPSCVDMLRNEKPLYFHHLPGQASNTFLSTRAEPVGEGEV